MQSVGNAENSCSVSASGKALFKPCKLRFVGAVLEHVAVSESLKFLRSKSGDCRQCFTFACIVICIVFGIGAGAGSAACARDSAR
jgi:hypothetical protein